ncbi:MAG: Crp/Fnr family transcriptional regulator, partial [Hyphomicrobiaceae bacterium]
MSKTSAQRARVARTTLCAQCPLRPLATFRNFTPEELAFVEGFKIGERHFSAGETILSEGDESSDLYTLLSGWAFKHKSL